MERIYPRLSQRNIEEEVLFELEKVQLSNKNEPTATVSKTQDPGSVTSPEENSTEYHLRTNYSRDFGRFEVTICTGDDGTQIVLVLLEGRVALNGKPIRFLDDGRVADLCGDPDPLLQRYYDCAMKARAEREKDCCDGEEERVEENENAEIPLTSERDVRESLKSLTITTQLIFKKIKDLQQLTRSQAHRKSSPGCFRWQRRSSTTSSCNNLHDSDDVELEDEILDMVTLVNSLTTYEKALSNGFRIFQKYREDLERDSTALVWTVTSFCREAILRESEKFVHDRYRDLYDKYMQAIAREENLIKQLGSEKEKNENVLVEVDKLENGVKLLNKGVESCFDDKLPSAKEDLENEIKRLKKENNILRMKFAKSRRQKETDKLRIAQLEKWLDINAQHLKFQTKNTKKVITLEESLVNEAIRLHNPPYVTAQKVGVEIGKLEEKHAKRVNRCKHEPSGGNVDEENDENQSSEVLADSEDN